MQLSELCCSSTNPAIKVERIIHENQIVAFSQIRNETNGIVRVNIGDEFVDVENKASIFSIEDVGAYGKSFYNNEFVKEISLDEYRLLNCVVEGLSEYSKNLYVQGSVTLLQIFPYSMVWSKAITTGPAHREEDIELSSPFTTVPFRKSTVIEGKLFDDCDILSVCLIDSLADSRQWLDLNIKKMLGYIPNNIAFTVNVDNKNFINFELKDENDKDANTVKRYIGDILKEMDVNTSVETVLITR